MSLPDLSFLLHTQSPEASQADAPSAPPESAPHATIALQPQEALPGLVAELRAYQAELESQNKVLQYSQAAAESASAASMRAAIGQSRRTRSLGKPAAVSRKRRKGRAASFAFIPR